MGSTKPVQLQEVLTALKGLKKSPCSISAAGAPGESQEAVHEGGAAGQTEPGGGAGQAVPPHRQDPGPPDRGGSQRQTCGPRLGEADSAGPAELPVAGSNLLFVVL